MKSLGVFLGEERDYGIGMFFFPQDELKRNQAKKMFEVIVEKEGLELLAWREVPTDPTVIGTESCRTACHTLCRRLSNVRMMWKKVWILTGRLYVARRVFEQSNDNTYVVSLFQQNDCLQRNVPGKRTAFVLHRSAGSGL